MRKIHLYLMVIVSALFVGCQTTIPERDTVHPHFIFRITGGGLNENLSQDFDFDNKVLYLKRGGRYNVIYSAGDNTATRAVLWELPVPPAIQFEEPFPNGWTGRAVTETKYHIDWVGSRDNPLTGAILGTNMVVNGYTTSTVEELEFFFAVEDFHGNEMRKPLTIRIHNEDPRIGPR